MTAPLYLQYNVVLLPIEIAKTRERLTVPFIGVIYEYPLLKDTDCFGQTQPFDVDEVCASDVLNVLKNPGPNHRALI